MKLIIQAGHFWSFTHPETQVMRSSMHAAGYLEGFLTRDLMWMHWQNVLKGYCYNKTDVCGLIDDFINTNQQYTASMIEKNPNDPYWYQVKLYYIQLEGLAAGYNAATKPM
ncbi:phospholipase B-like protein B [Manduca sexta]|uniref:phospholipase B-like protein B n=1 Tax=Manduca sexta TaxID=7130 RepID=UPI00188EEB3B|nr:phospholipase B-like protein B [Manduca sexta]